MIQLSALVGGGLAALAFPPVGWWPLAIVGPALWLWGLARADRGWQGAVSGLTNGLVFFAGVIWWIVETEPEAVVVLVIVQAGFHALFGWLLVKLGRSFPSGGWWILAAGLWAMTEALRYRAPVGGFEWGALGYAMSDLEWARAAARWIGASGWTVLLMAAAAALASVRTPKQWRRVLPVTGLIVIVVAFGAAAGPLPAGIPVEAAIVQGSTPCPFKHCPDERRLTYLQHLALTGAIPPGRANLVVWSEGSTGSSNADPVNNPEVGAAIGAEAARLGAWIMVGSDRPVSDTTWINANVLFSPGGEIVGEYRKQHPVPFGEYVPWRPVFGLIPSTDQVPRDMIRGDGPEVFDLAGYQMGSVISFEGAFARYIRETVNEGADLLVVATNEGGFGETPASDQLIGMTRMRSAETGLDLIHAAVTGKSTFITDGGVVGEVTELAALDVIYATVSARPGLTTVYVRMGDWVMALAAAAAGAVWVWTRSRPRPQPEA